MLKNVPRYCKESNMTKSDLKRKVLELVVCDTEEEFDLIFEELPDSYKQYLNQHWMTHKKSWANCFTKHLTTYGNLTNNILERHNRILKTISSSSFNIPSMFEEFLIYQEKKKRCRIKLY